MSLMFLRLAPLLTSTATLMYAHDHDRFFRAFIHPAHTPAANALIPSWTAAMMPRGGLTIFTLYPLTLLFALLNYFDVGATATVTGANVSGAIMEGAVVGGTQWYGYGALFTIAHFFFAKWAIGLLNAMKGDESKGRATEDMRKWVGMNVLRTMFVDLPGWVCYLVAVTGSLKV